MCSCNLDVRACLRLFAITGSDKLKLRTDLIGFILNISKIISVTIANAVI